MGIREGNKRRERTQNERPKKEHNFIPNSKLIISVEAGGRPCYAQWTNLRVGIKIPIAALCLLL